MTEPVTILVDAYMLPDLVGAYKRLEARMDEAELRHKEELAPMKAALAQLSGAITILMDKNALENVRTEYGTAYFSVTESIKVVDREIYANWVIDNRATDVLTTAVSKDAVRDRRDRGEEVPGLEIIPVRKLHVRKPT